MKLAIKIHYEAIINNYKIAVLIYKKGQPEELRIKVAWNEYKPLSNTKFRQAQRHSAIRKGKRQMLDYIYALKTHRNEW